jgi:hypothetical protein
MSLRASFRDKKMFLSGDHGINKITIGDILSTLPIALAIVTVLYILGGCF